MITIKELNNKQFDNLEDAYKALKESKDIIIAQKTSSIKHTDCVVYSHAVNEKGEAVKSNEINVEEVETLKVKIVINTTNLFDSHKDVSINGSWNRSVNNTKNIYLLQEHQMTFEKIITDEVKAVVEVFDWKELGFDFEGKTEALVFYATIHKERNPFMFKQYAKGYVKEHSAGLRYVQLALAINSEAEWNKEEKEVWDKYYSQIANKEELDDYGYFWAVTEQKIIEGSAVVKGSNYATPTLNVELVDDTFTESKETDSSADTPIIEQVKNNINLNLF